MTTSSDDALSTHQGEVQRLLGRCLMRLQQCEHLIKAIIAHYEVTGPVHALETVQAARIAVTGRKTLGMLVGDLFGSYVVADKDDNAVNNTISSVDDVASFSFRATLSLSEADFVRTESELKEFVLLRNNLVHHFVEHHDLQSLDGCRNAQNALLAADCRIDQHLEQLRGWAEKIMQNRRLMAEFVRSGEFHDLVINGITPNGEVEWPAAGIVRALREAAGALAVAGWAPVTEASRWIAERHPDQLPAKYGCRSWRQVLHESRIFELRYLEQSGNRSAWYREKVNSEGMRPSK